MMNTNQLPLDLDQFDALIFDCDGTLADTMPAHYLAWQETAKRHGLVFPKDRFYALGGVPAKQILEMLSAQQGVKLDAQAVAHEKEKLFLDRYLDAAVGIEPVLAIARAYKQRVPLAVATGGVGPVVKRCLRNLGIHDWFKVIVSSEDVEHHKPAPDTYLLAARLLKISPSRCCAFEDTDLGLQSVRSAGMTAVDVRSLLP